MLPAVTVTIKLPLKVKKRQCKRLGLTELIGGTNKS